MPHGPGSEAQRRGVSHRRSPSAGGRARAGLDSASAELWAPWFVECTRRLGWDGSCMVQGGFEELGGSSGRLEAACPNTWKAARGGGVSGDSGHSHHPSGGEACRPSSPVARGSKEHAPLPQGQHADPQCHRGQGSPRVSDSVPFCSATWQHWAAPSIRGALSSCENRLPCVGFNSVSGSSIFSR